VKRALPTIRKSVDLFNTVNPVLPGVSLSPGRSSPMGETPDLGNTHTSMPSILYPPSRNLVDTQLDSTLQTAPRESAFFMLGVVRRLSAVVASSAGTQWAVAIKCIDTMGLAVSPLAALSLLFKLGRGRL
jgi:hypothetical protein